MIDTIRTPYLLFLGDAGRDYGAKTAEGVLHWRPQSCIGQSRLPGCGINLGIAELGFAEAVERGAGTLLLGVANRGGFLPETWIPSLVEAMEAGLDLAAGLHQRLADVPALRDAAQRTGRTLHDVRHWRGGPMPLGTGLPRTGRRVLMVGTDCAVGKKFSALAVHQAMCTRGLDADFRPTGQTGALIAGHGVALDTIPGDFIAGVAEQLSPAADPSHWDVIEGQASVLHPTFAPVTVGLVMGAQPHALIVCHAVGRDHMRGLPHWPMPSISATIAAHLETARVTSPGVTCVGLSVNTAPLAEADARDYLGELEQRHGVPATDPIRFGADPLVDALEQAVPPVHP